MSCPPHDFDPMGGWCSRCAYREDGRLMSFTGDEYRPGPDYTSQQLHDFLKKGQAHA